MARASADYVITATDRTQQTFRRINRSLQSLTGSFASLGRVGKGLAVGGLGFLGVRGLQEIVTGSLDSANALLDLSTRLETTTEFLSKARFAAAATGVRFEGLATGLQRLTRRAADAAAGNQGLRDAFDELGLDADKFNRMKLDEQMFTLADALNDVEDRGDKVRLAFKLLDTEGVALLQTFAGGSRELRKLFGDAERAGAVVGEGTAKAAAEANKQFLELRESVAAAFRNVVLQLAPQIGAFARWVKENLADSLQGWLETLTDIRDLWRSIGSLASNVAAVFKRTTRPFAEAIGTTAAGVRAMVTGGEGGARTAESGLASFGQSAVLALSDLRRFLTGEGTRKERREGAFAIEIQRRQAQLLQDLVNRFRGDIGATAQ